MGMLHMKVDLEGGGCRSQIKENIDRLERGGLMLYQLSLDSLKVLRYKQKYCTIFVLELKKVPNNLNKYNIFTFFSHFLKSFDTSQHGINIREEVFICTSIFGSIEQ